MKMLYCCVGVVVYLCLIVLFHVITLVIFDLMWACFAVELLFKWFWCELICCMCGLNCCELLLICFYVAVILLCFWFDCVLDCGLACDIAGTLCVCCLCCFVVLT